MLRLRPLLMGPSGLRHCAVVGSPIAHSLSPVLHRAGYAAAGLDWRYDAYDVDAEGLPAFLGGLDESWRGLSLTMPLKRAVVPLLDEVSPQAAAAGAANTVVLENGLRTGHNTDVGGAAAAIRERWAGPVESAIVLGGGATAASVLLALATLGCRSAIVVVRDPSRAQVTVEAVAQHPAAPQMELRGFGTPLGDADILVSTIPAAAQSVDLVATAERVKVVFDVVYDPWPTPLAASRLADGRCLVSGLDLLVHQAALQFTLMTRLERPPMTAMRSAGEKALTRSQR